MPSQTLCPHKHLVGNFSISLSEKWYLKANRASSFDKVVPLFTAAVNFSCVPLLRAARAAVSLDWLGSSMATCLFESLNSSLGSVLVEDQCPLRLYSPFTFNYPLP